jgi:hypothetical protein
MIGLAGKAWLDQHCGLGVVEGVNDGCDNPAMAIVRRFFPTEHAALCAIHPLGKFCPFHVLR